MAGAVDRDVLGDVERERRLSHAGPGGEDDQLRIVQPAGEVVEIDEAGFQPAVGMLMLHAGIDAGQRLVQHVAHRPDLRVALGVEDAKHALLGPGEHLAGVDRRLVRFLDDVGAGVNQRAEHRLVADDAGVVLGVGGRGHFLAQLEQVGGAADDFVLAGVLAAAATSSVGSICRPSSCRASMWREDRAVGVVVEVFRRGRGGRLRRTLRAAGAGCR